MSASIEVEVYVENNYPLQKVQKEKFNPSSLDTVPWQDWFNIWLNSSKVDLPSAKSYELSVLFTDDDSMTEFNNQYRHKKQPTDVLAFAALENEMVLPQELSASLYLGDIVISLDTAFAQALEQNHSLITELSWLATHGLLHLLGWDHPDDQSLEKMLQKQGNLLKLVDFTE